MFDFQTILGFLMLQESGAIGWDARALWEIGRAHV